MFKVIYKEKIHTVYDVKTERFMWARNGKGNNEPDNTWFLIGDNGYFRWVQAFECMTTGEYKDEIN